MNRFTWALAAILSLLLGGCATPYGSSGLTGGYKEEQISANTYRITFTGNGFTSGDMVWNYWMYRCAEFARLKGYDVIVSVPDLKKSIPSIDDQLRPSRKIGTADRRAHLVPAVMNDQSEGRMVPTHGGHGGGGYSSHYVYVPGGTVTSYRKTGIIAMFHDSDAYDTKFALRAQTIVDELKPYVDSHGKLAAPPRMDILRKAMLSPLPIATPSKHA